MSPAKKAAPFDRVRTLGLKLPDVTLGKAWGGPALKVNGQLLALMATNKQAEPNTLVVRVSFFERDFRIANESEVFYVKPHYVDYECVLARLDVIKDGALKKLLDSGREFVSSKSKRRSRA